MTDFNPERCRELLEELNRAMREGGIKAESIPELAAQLEAALAEIDRLSVWHRRYEIVRRMHVEQFKDVFKLNISTGKPFDEIIDDLAPFMRQSGRG